MKIGLIGLGKMGIPLALNARDHGLDIVVYSTKVEKINELKIDGIPGFSSLDNFVNALEAPRNIWLMVPAGEPTDTTILQLLPYLSKGDRIIDGGNSWYRDSMRRYDELKLRGIHFMDAGTSGGTDGALNGACLMVGGDKIDYAAAEPIFRALSHGNGCAHLGPAGAGHFAKMIHNGIEYGMMQALGEGLSLIRECEFDYELDQVADVWRNGSIISGLLMDVTADALAKDPDLDSLRGIVSTSGEADWTLQESIRLKVATPVIAAALYARYKSQDTEHFTEKSLAAMRREFGGHAVVDSEGGKNNG